VGTRYDTADAGRRERSTWNWQDHPGSSARQDPGLPRGHPRRIIRCTVDTATACERIIERAERDAHRAAHGDRELLRDIVAGERSVDSFAHISLDAPAMTVDTSAGYRPDMDAIAAFVTQHAG
jgi:hypothetical protein